MTSTPPADEARRDARARLPLPPGPLAGFIVAVLALLGIAYFSYRALEAREAAANRVTQTLAVLEQLRGLQSSIKDAETGQRGFLLTGIETYLEPYTAARVALETELAVLRAETVNTPRQQQRLDGLQKLVSEKLQELAETIDLRRAGDAVGALAIVRSARGKVSMDRIRAVTGEMEEEERLLLAQRQEEWRAAVTRSSLVTGGGSALLLVLIGASALMTSRDYRARETEAWLRRGQTGLSTRIQGEQRLDVLGDNVLRFLADYLDAQVGAVYVADAGERFQRVASYALSGETAEIASDERHVGEGLLGQAAKDNRLLHVRDVPADYLPVASSLGRGTPRQLAVAPATADGVVQAVIELGFFRALEPADLAFLARASEALGVAVRASKDRTRLEALLEETQRQGEELQAQQEELRVNNEELEEQGRALRESQTRLEMQQVELEQTNAQLEEQAQMLEHQRDDLAAAQTLVTERAAELERANRYKSEFLANMSHELRTPLNSSLILAKILSDNKDGNLTGEQVKFAQTILGAGNDLLVLINDILDLSKIEAGKVDISAEPVLVPAAVEGLVKSLQPVAAEKGLAFEAVVAPDVPARIVTDPQRLGQILKNLLSNAMKFTEKGRVTLQVSAPTAETLAFAVRDTGIGIALAQQGVIFEAFRQADGTTHRKYGGTGLGLSISRDLARLLGGDISVESRVGEGSVFTLTLPRTYAGALETRRSSPADGPAPGIPSLTSPVRASAGWRDASGAATSSPSPSLLASPLAPPVIDDDRDRLDGDHERRMGADDGAGARDGGVGTDGRAADLSSADGQAADVVAAAGAGAEAAAVRLILVIEDDPGFATILRDLAREMRFRCIVTATAADGLAAAARYRPSAILLDISLPDHSGLGVLDELKHTSATRHIPVHVISASDYAQEALERGAIGYVLKPVKREQLIDAFRRLEAKASQRLRRVLVVEDDARQRESVRTLLENDEVEIRGVATAADALAALQSTTFDCVVMDLNLPDVSGYDLLETMANTDGVSFPPVIVYTGRNVSRDEEQRLRRFSKSIIVKDARSPERLLDEVTLFLHQVEAGLPLAHQRMLKAARHREATFEGRRILIVEDDARNIFALSSLLEPKGAKIEIARNGKEALAVLARSLTHETPRIDLVLMDIMMPEMDGLTAMREIRARPEWRKLPIIALTAKAMKDDHEQCLAAGANDYIAKPLDVEKLVSLVRVWMPK